MQNLTKREHMATQILVGLLAGKKDITSKVIAYRQEFEFKDLPELAVLLADSLEAALK